MSHARKELSRIVTGGPYNSACGRHGSTRRTQRKSTGQFAIGRCRKNSSSVIRIPVLSDSVSMLSLPLAVVVAGNESDRPVIDAAVQKIIVHANGEDVLLAELNGFRRNGICAEFQVLPALHMSCAGMADAFAIQYVSSTSSTFPTSRTRS